MSKVIKRDASVIDFNKHKISAAILKAMKNGSGIVEERIAYQIADEIEQETKEQEFVDIYEIEDLVYDKLIKKGQSLTAKAYEGYRRIREFQRESVNTIDNDITQLLDGDSDYWKHENANKNAELNTTKRDYMAGIVSTDAVRRYLLSPEIVQAHDEGIIHFHDADYFLQHMANCCVFNLEDMLQNGTVISEVLIEKPHSFSTACTITTQIIAQVASSQYGGQTISLAHLAPFVDISRQRIRKEVIAEHKVIYTRINDDAINYITEKRLRKEITKGIQTIQYQLTTLMTCNGQAPFITIFMYLNEAKNSREKADLAILIKEVLNQRITGVKNCDGVYIAPAFPKLIYVLEEDNITEDSEYWYLTKLAAKCSAKRLVPDYISEKMMLELKGDVYGCMGCVDGDEIVTYKYNNNLYVESFERMWDRLSEYFKVYRQGDMIDNPNRYIDLTGVEIYDTEKGFVNASRIIRNISKDWVDVHLSNGRRLLCTSDHPFEICGKGVVEASKLSESDKILVHANKNYNTHYNTYSEVKEVIPVDTIRYSYDVTTDSEHFEVSGIYSHNCRSFLTPDRFTDAGIGNIANAKNYEPGKHKYYGRFNCGVVTISLPDIAFSSGGDMDKFWELFYERTELCHKALKTRHNRLKGTSSDVAPILWQYGALARLEKHEPIDKLLYGGYSTISLGYAGLYECVKYMTGCSHSDEGIGEKFGLEVMQALNDQCNKWKKEENIDYSLYGTPLENTTYKMAKKLKERFGKDIFVQLDGADRNYITNSYHIPVFEPIDAFEKLRIESKFQKLSPGGAISYVESPSMVHNSSALLEVIKYMYEHIMYAEINTKSCYCEKCGFDGEIPLIDENGTLKWKCPKCGNDDNTTMDIAFRVCGYIGTAKNGGNQGRYGDIHDRVRHIDDMEYTED